MNYNLLDKIVASIRFKNQHHCALLSGQNSKTILLALINDNKYEDETEQIAQKSIESIEKENITYTFCNGIAGICWTLEYLRKSDKLVLEADCLDEIDIVLADVAVREIEKGKWDFLHGGLGVNIYIHERDNKVTLSYYNKWLEIIEKISIQTPYGISWLCYNDVAEREVQNFGLSHGIPSILVALCKCGEYEEYKEKAQDLASKTIQNLLFYRKTNNIENISQFPAWIIENQPIEYSTRLAWCYGDLGVAIAIVNAGITFKNQDWLNNGIDIAEKTLSRVFNNKHNIEDAGFCHGYFGTAYIYQKFYYLTKDLKFKEAADYLYEIGLIFIESENEQINTKVFKYKDKFIENFDIINGLSGIGLTLLGREDRKYTDWDKIFLLFPTP